MRRIHWSFMRAFLVLGLMSVWSVIASAQTHTLPLGHVAGDDTLGFVTWEGWKEPDPKSTNRTERLLAEESLRAFFKELVAEIDKSIDEQTKRSGQPAVTTIASAVPMILKTALTHPTAFVVNENGNGTNPVSFGLVIDAGSEIDGLMSAVNGLLKSAVPQEGPKRPIEESVGGGKFLRPQEADPFGLIRVGSKGKYFIVTIGDEATDNLLKRLDQNKTPSFVTDALADAEMPRPHSLIYASIRRITALAAKKSGDPDVDKMLKLWGLANLKEFTFVSGYSADGMQLNSAIHSDGPLSGLFSLIPNKPLTIDSFKRVPATASNAMMARFDLNHVMNVVFSMMKEMEPAKAIDAQNALEGLSTQVGFSLQEDLAKGLGDEWSFYTSGSEAGVFFLPGIVITATVRDQAKVQKALDVLVAVLKAEAQSQAERGAASFGVTEYSVRGNKAVRIQFNGLPIPLQPAWVLTKDELVLAMTPQLLSSHFSQVAKASLADAAPLKEAFKRQPQTVFATYSDPKPGLQTIYGLVNSFGPLVTGQLAQQGVNFTLPPLPPMSDIDQHLAPNVTTMALTDKGMRTETRGVVPSGFELSPTTSAVAIALLLPAVQQAREAARRSQDKNNLKQIAIALHNSHETYNEFPASAIQDKKGKELLSWRVHILPYVDQLPLYEQFHLDEPWDSEHNKKLIERMPPVYKAPHLSAQTIKDGKTTYLAPKGKGLAWEGKKGMKIRDFTDGTSNTILLVEAKESNAVVWTKPEDLEVDMKEPLKALKSAVAGGFHILLADGSVRFVSDMIDVETFKKLLTRNGGEVVDAFGF